jgi:hypothetical protein
MSEPTRDELLLRISRLERANRRWRLTAYALGSLLATGFVFLLLEFRTNYLLATHARQEAERAERAALKARQQDVLLDDLRRFVQAETRTPSSSLLWSDVAKKTQQTPVQLPAEFRDIRWPWWPLDVHEMNTLAVDQRSVLDRP